MSLRGEIRDALLSLAKVEGVERVYRAVPIADQAVFPHVAMLGDDEDRREGSFQRRDFAVEYGLMVACKGLDPDVSSRRVDEIVDRIDDVIETDPHLGLGVAKVHRAVVVSCSTDRGVTADAATFAVMTVRVEFRRSRGAAA